VSYTADLLGNIVHNLDSKRIPLNRNQRNAKKEFGKFPYIGANNILDYIDEYIFDEEILCIAEDGGSWGKAEQCATVFNEKCWVNNHTHVVSYSGRANLSYLKFYLNYDDLNSYITGSTRGKLTRTKLDSIEIPLPPLDDQIRIAYLLTRVEKLIAKRKESIKLLDEYLKSTFLEMFGDPVRNEKEWEKKRIDKIADSRLGKMLDKKFITGQHLKYYLGNSNVKWFSFDLNTLGEMDFDEDECIKFSLEHGDLLVCESGEIGRCAIWKCEKEDIYFQKALHRIRVDTKQIEQEYLQYAFFRYAMFGGFRNVTSKATIEHLTGEKLKQTFVPVPPFSLQNKFAAIVGKWKRLNRAINRASPNWKICMAA